MEEELANEFFCKTVSETAEYLGNASITGPAPSFMPLASRDGRPGDREQRTQIALSMIKSMGTMSGHPRVALEYRSDGPVIVHDRRGSPEEVRRSRLWISAAGLAGMAAIGLSVLRLQRLERLDAPNSGIALLVAVGLALFTGFAVYFGHGWEEIEVTFNNLQVRALPLDLGRGRVVHRSQVDHVQIEKDKGGLRDRYRVQLIGPEGQGLLPSYGALSGIATQDEATALAGAIARQFELPFTPGVQPETARTTLFEKWSGQEAGLDELKADPYLPAQKEKAAALGRIRVKQAGYVPVVSYYNTSEAAGFMLFGLLWCAFLVPLTLSLISDLRLNPDRFSVLIFLILFWGAGIQMLWRGLHHTEIWLDANQLRCHHCLGSVAIIKEQVSLENVQRVATAVAWDSYDNMYHRVVAQLKNGYDLTIIDKLPEDDGHALVQALHEHLGLPITP